MGRNGRRDVRLEGARGVRMVGSSAGPDPAQRAALSGSLVGAGRAIGVGPPVQAAADSPAGPPAHRLMLACKRKLSGLF